MAPEHIAAHAQLFDSLSKLPTLTRRLLPQSLRPFEGSSNPKEVAQMLTDLLKDSKVEIYTTEALHLVSLSRLFAKSEYDHLLPMVSPFLLHLAMLRHLTLPQRHIATGKSPSVETATDAKFDEFFNAVIAQNFYVLDSSEFVSLVKMNAEIKDEARGFEDFLDGRLFKAIVTNGVHIDEVPDSIRKSFLELTAVLKSLLPSDRAIPTIQSDAKMEKAPQDAPQVARSLQVLPFHSPVFQSHLAGIQLDFDVPSSGVSTEPAQSLFEKALYETHWHNTGLIDESRLERRVSRAQKKESWMLRRDQIASARMRDNALSLAGSGGALVPEKIIPRSTTGEPKGKGPAAGGGPKPKEKAKESPKKAPGGKKTAGGKKGKPSKADMIIAANIQLKTAKLSRKSVDAWKLQYQEISNLSDVRAKISHLDGYIKRSTDEAMTVEARLLKCIFLFDIWKASYFSKDSNPPPEGRNVVAVLFNEAKQIVASPNLTARVNQHLETLFAALGFPKFAPKASTATLPATPPIITFPVAKIGKSGSAAVGMGLTEFQLRHCGLYMDRNLGSKQDSRVKFEPDAWQVKVLDALDEDKSVFVVAPTSAGKTFIAYYAMEKVSRCRRGSCKGAVLMFVP